MSPALAVWAAAAGALIPAMAVINGRLGRSLGSSLFAVVALFGVGLSASLALTLLVERRLPTPARLASEPVQSYAAGLIVLFYIATVTALAPKLGVGSTILFVMVAQVVSSTAIDHFGLLDAPVQRLSSLRAVGVLLVLAGLGITQVAPAGGRP